MQKRFTTEFFNIIFSLENMWAVNTYFVPLIYNHSTEKTNWRTIQPLNHKNKNIYIAEKISHNFSEKVMP